MTQHARVTGTVISRDVRVGRNDNGPWKLHLADVFFKGGATTTVTFMENAEGSTPVTPPRVGEQVDYLVDFGVRSGRNGGAANLGCQVVMAWDQQANIVGVLMAGQTAPAQDISTGSPRPAAVPSSVKAS